MGTVYGSKCPIAAGPADVVYDIKLVSILPPALGSASFHFTAKDQKGTDIICLQAHLGIQVEDNMEADSDTFVKGDALKMLAPPVVVAARADSNGLPVKFSAKDCGASSGH